jgi:hypothetical protein
MRKNTRGYQNKQEKKSPMFSYRCYDGLCVLGFRDFSRVLFDHQFNCQWAREFKSLESPIIKKNDTSKVARRFVDVNCHDFFYHILDDIIENDNVFTFIDGGAQLGAVEIVNSVTKRHRVELDVRFFRQRPNTHAATYNYYRLQDYHKGIQRKPIYVMLSDLHKYKMKEYSRDREHYRRKIDLWKIKVRKLRKKEKEDNELSKCD